MKILKRLLLALTGAALLSCVAGCKANTDPQGGSDPTYFTVTFDSDGGSEVKTQKVESGKKAVRPDDPEKTGHSFDDWYKDNDAYNFETPVTADLELKAHWNANSYTITLKNGENNSTKQVTYGQNIPDLESNEIPSSTDGSYFLGYFLESEKYIDKDGKGIKAWQTAANGELTAKWGYIITLENIDGVEETDLPEEYTSEDEITLPSNLTRKGYTFLGWFDAETGGTKVEKIAAGSTGTKTFYAHWEAKSYTVTLANGTVTITKTVTFAQPLEDIEPPASQESDFQGYFTQAYGKGEQYIDKDGKGIKAWDIDADTTLYAAWGFAIVYNNTKDVKNDNAKVYTGETDVTIEAISKEGYEFLGWFDAETDGTKIEKIAAGSTGTKTLYAHWEAIEYTITYNGIPEGVTNPNTTVKYTVDSPEIVIQDASAEGSVFDGWFDEDGEKVTSIPAGSTGNIVLEAKWTNAVITVTVAPKSDITIAKEVTEEYIILTAAAGYTNYEWRFDDVVVTESFELAEISDEGRTLKVQLSKLKENAVYQINVSGKKGLVKYGTQISISK